MTVWTAENIKLLKAGAAAGKSYSDVAQEIGGDCTRDAVAGKAFRLGVRFTETLEARREKCRKGGYASAAKRWGARA